MEQLGQFIINHWGLWAAFIGILLLILINESLMQKNKAQELSPQAAVDKINNDDAIVIDLRDAEAFKAGHIIDAVRATVEDFALPKMNKYKNKPLILVCAKGLTSRTAAVTLAKNEFQPMVLSGGMDAWKNAGFPLIKGKAK